MKISCIQMDMQLGCPQENFRRAVLLITQAMAENPDVIVLPETFNTGFFPRTELEALCDRDGQQTKTVIGSLAAKFRVNIIAGSISNLRDGKVYNTAMVFDRAGRLVASYDKTHLFTPMGEDRFYTPGNRLCSFTLDGVSCGILICYDLRFPELSRSYGLAGTDVLFLVSQWPETRIAHLQTLCAARAIENQMFVVCCNSCGTAGETVYGGNSMMIDPWGQALAAAGRAETLLSGNCDLAQLPQIRAAIPVYRDRRTQLLPPACHRE